MQAAEGAIRRFDAADVREMYGDYSWAYRDTYNWLNLAKVPALKAVLRAPTPRPQVRLSPLAPRDPPKTNSVERAPRILSTNQR